jgi:hypothetical protein
MRRSLAVLLVAATWLAAAGLSAPSALADQGRWKVGDSGCYWDPNDDGPDQCSPSDPNPPSDPPPLYSQDLLDRAAQAAGAIQASGADPNDVNTARVVLQAAWNAGLPPDSPFTFFDPALASQIIIVVQPPRPQPPQSECVQLQEAQDKLDQMEVAMAGLSLGYGVLLGWASTVEWAALLVPGLNVGVALTGTVLVAIELYKSQVARWAGGCPA